MQTITYTCDRCKAADTTNAIDIIPINITLFQFKSVVKSAEWCRRCLNEVGLNSSMPKIPTIEPPLSVEDIIREIVKEEINHGNLQ